MNTPERATTLVLGWARTYTRGIDDDARTRRLEELASDCFEQRRWGVEVGASPAAVATSMVARTLAGVPADLLWRQGQLAASRDRSPNPRGRPMGRWIKENWWVALATLAGAMFTIAGVMAPFEGEVEGGLPWWAGMLLMLVFGGLLLGGVWFRRRRRVVGDWMIAVGTLPLFPLFWTIVLPVLGLLIVIPAILDAADASATATTPDPAAEVGRDRTTLALLVLLAITVATSVVVGQADVAFALVGPVLSLLVAHLGLRSGRLQATMRLGLTALLASLVHGLLLVVVVVLDGTGSSQFTDGPALVANTIMSMAGTAGLVAVVVAALTSRGKARPA